MKNKLLIVGALALTAASLQAQIIYTQDFESNVPAGPAGWTSTGGYSANVSLFANSFGSNASAAAFLDVQRYGGGPTDGAGATIVSDTGVAYVPGTGYTFGADLAKTDGSTTVAIDVTFELFAGDPGSGGLLLGSFVSTGLNVGGVSFDTTPNGGGSGNLFIRFGSPIPDANPTSYRQAQVDNISISITPVPEPSAAAAFAGAAALGLVALRRRRRA